MTYLSDLLSADQVTALERFEQMRQADAPRAVLDAERAWDEAEERAFGPRPSTGSALAGPAPDHLAWLRWSRPT